MKTSEVHTECIVTCIFTKLGAVGYFTGLIKEGLMTTIYHADNLAPIALSTYSRLGHLKKTVDALKENELACASELHIFSDAPKPGDEDKVQSVRDYLKTIDGFKCVHIYEREKNNRVENNRGGMRMLLEKYDRMIFLEEDVVTSPHFLRFMNDALDVYKNDDKILAISGYGPAVDNSRGVNSDTFLGKRAFCWAFALWKEQFQKIEMQIKPSDYLKIRLNPFLTYKYIRAGEDVIHQLRMVAYSQVEALDIRMDYTMFRHDLFMIYPICSMIQSIGHDGSGEHWTASTNKFDVKLCDRVLKVMPRVMLQPEISYNIAKFHKCSFNQKLRLWLTDLGLLSAVLYLRSLLHRHK